MNIHERLLELKNEEYRQFTARLVPNIPAETIIGLKTPEMRAIAKEIFTGNYRMNS